ncbi:hypothetical protein QEN19_002385 [Hanseniaspora menglaensis]
MGMKYDLSADISILETFDNNHVVYKQNYHFLGDSKENSMYFEFDLKEFEANEINSFTFTSLDEGEHSICINPYIKSFNTRRLVKEGLNEKVKVYLDFERVPLNNIMEVITQYNSKFLLTSKKKIDVIYKKLNQIKVDQLLFKQKYTQFQILSDKTNNRILTWGIIQSLWLSGVCYVQLKFLKQFFRRHKVV